MVKLSEIQVKEIMARMETLIARKGMKKKDFYAASGISSSLYSQWNTGTVKPSLRLLAQAAETLGVEVDVLINGKEKAPSESGERATDEQLKFALFDGAEDISDAQLDEVKAFAKWVKQRDEKKG